MSDYLVDLGQKAWFRKTTATLGLPIPIPQRLERGQGAIRENELAGKNIMVSGNAAKEITTIIAATGANVVAAADKANGLVFDARKLADVAALSSLYNFFHDNIKKLSLNARIIVLAADPASTATPEAAAAAQAINGFVRSLAKEIGRKGATANTLYVAPDAHKNLAGPLRFFLSPRSTFVDGQPVLVGVSQTTGKAVWAQALKGKTALVTGAARGIGADVAQRLAEEGARTIILDVPQAQEALLATATRIGGEALALDVTATDAAAKIREAAGGKLDILVNNAGITRDKTIGNMDSQKWDLALAVNLAASLTLSKDFLTDAASGGRVVCLSSIAGIGGNFGQTNYAAAKAGVIGFVRHLAESFAASGATINAVAPGFIETQMTAAVPLMTREGGRRIANLKQGGLPVDVAELITFLASPGAAGVNGQVIRVCGGNLMGA